LVFERVIYYYVIRKKYYYIFDLDKTVKATAINCIFLAKALRLTWMYR